MTIEAINISSRRLCVGVITASHGVRGQIRVKSFTASPEDIAAYVPLTDAGGGTEYRLQWVGQAKGVLLAKVEGVRDRDAADALRGVELFVERDQLPQIEDGDVFYYADLIGLSAVLPDGKPYGTVKALHDFGAGNMIEFKLKGSGDILLPFTKEVVPEINLDAGWVTVEPPEMFGDPEPALPTEDKPERASEGRS